MGGRQKKYLKKLCPKEIISPTLLETKKPQVQAQQIPSTGNMKKTTPTARHHQITLTSDKEKILKGSREKQTLKYKGTKIGMIADFSSEIRHTLKD